VIGSDRERLLGADRELYDDVGRAHRRLLCRPLGVPDPLPGRSSGVRCGLAHGRRLPRGRVLRQVWRAIGPPEPLRSVDGSHRDRILRTYRSRIRSLVIDEAQDVSAVQHAALSHIVTSESRVFACGDGLQRDLPVATRRPAVVRRRDDRGDVPRRELGYPREPDGDHHLPVRPISPQGSTLSPSRCSPTQLAGTSATSTPRTRGWTRLATAVTRATGPRSTSRRSQASVTPAPRCGRIPTGRSGRRTCSRPVSRGARRRNLLQRRRRPARRHGAVPPRDADARVRDGVRCGRPPGPHCDRRAVRLPRRRDGGARRLRVADCARLSAAHEQTPHRVPAEHRVRRGSVRGSVVGPRSGARRRPGCRRGGAARNPPRTHPTP